MDTKKYEVGLCCGKFWPLHSGHQRLIQTTIDNSEVPVCFIVHRTWERPNANTRFNWISELYKDTELQVVMVRDPGVDTFTPEQKSRYWAGLVRMILPGEPDAVFTSEEYGSRWADQLNCEHHLIDIDRTVHPVSGTLVRRDPKLFWNHLPEPVQKWYEDNWEELEKYESPADFHVRYPDG